MSVTIPTNVNILTLGFDECVGAISPYGLARRLLCLVLSIFATAYDNKSGSCPVGRLISGYRQFIDLHQMRLGRRKHKQSKAWSPSWNDRRVKTHKIRVDLGNTQLQYWHSTMSWLGQLFSKVSVSMLTFTVMFLCSCRESLKFKRWWQPFKCP